MAAACLVVAIAFARAMRAFRWLRDHYGVVRIVSGLALVALGLLVFFDRLWWLQAFASRALGGG